MTAKVFVTGATGYIGGDALHAIHTAYPALQITALVRNSDKGAKVATQYPSIRLVYGSLDDTNLLSQEASQADIVCHFANADHASAAHALISGLAVKFDSHPGFLIHTSGTGILSVADLERKSYGVKNEKIYNDWDGVGEVTSLPDAAAHRDVDKIILAAGSAHAGKIKTAIVCPPCIHGPGRGPDNQRSMQVYEMARNTLSRGKGFHVGDGENLWTQVHVQDLSDVYVRLVGEALKDGHSTTTWGPEAYYFAEAGDFVWGDVARAIAKDAKKKGLIETDEVECIGTEEADKLTWAGSYMWGMNSRARAVRAGKLLGWRPSHPGLFELIPSIVDEEARKLGLTKGHAEQAAG